ncbi:NRDE family protein [Novosphingobium piscinae]|uniref:NRDE family protein n=1 Tax=Novosphingobium piscinae TaxID=1507448 RepID=A0A7X1FW21_9SPHN|nr:NRDE family protein [Novosphingobium piscinae]MBC2668033.1 NRDE family protein [Novosphingobium piscinae]
MCLAAIAFEADPRWRLVIAANRDEFHARPAAPLARWSDGSGIIAGRDETAGGTWLGLTETGRLALVTNFRVPGFPLPDRPSRGRLVTDVLAGRDPVGAGLAAMNPCNLLVVEGAAASFVTNYPELATRQLEPGLHGLSNGALAPPWRKTEQTMAALRGWLDGAAESSPEGLFAALADPRPTAESWEEGGPEPRLSSPFIRDPSYGTRCSTVVLVDRSGAGTIIERRFTAHGQPAGEVAIAFRW